MHSALPTRRVKLSVVIVSYNVCHFLEQALLSVRKAAARLGEPVEVFVVDNHSADGSVAMVRTRFPEVILLENKTNPGFSTANNQALRRARGQYVLLLNPDTVVEEDAFQQCCQFMDEHPEGGGMGVHMLDGQGRFLPESKRGLPTPWVAFYKVFGLAWLFPKSRTFGRYHLGYLSKEQTHEVDVLSGAFMLMRRQALDEVGLLDEDYFMYGEDIDLSYRLTQGGWKNYYYPGTRIIHYKGESTRRTSINYVFVFYRAMVIFAGKHFAPGKASVFSLLLNLAIWVRAGAAVAHRVVAGCAPALLDAVGVGTGLLAMRAYWPEATIANPAAVPAWVATWLTAAYLSGTYDQPPRLWPIMRGILLGTVALLAVDGFAEAGYAAKTLLLGGSWAAAIMAGWRVAVHAVRHGSVHLHQPRTRRVAIVGSKAESSRVRKLLRQSGAPVCVVGHVSPSAAPDGRQQLGPVSELPAIIRRHRVDELIFCGQDLTSQQIMTLMAQLPQRLNLVYRILAQDSQYIVGSSSRVAAGDYYAPEQAAAAYSPAPDMSVLVRCFRWLGWVPEANNAPRD
ncbi:glycosyltransferase [Hymenobacter aerilatus]|uniref:Glycosyltransferase n=1 Tax=Hymenobacter aerilatus TaxID=2932251 RepID=A0A8T9SY85_9BACT|nr:glycosyltransferase [Hymenobacter aerilatus]UOR05884.1 glycosyltransferase [Hymenobacter aerilatus]